MKKIHNIKSISELAGVSPSTVSRIMSGNARKYRIAEKTEKRVLDIAQKLGFKPNYFAHSLNTGKTYNIGLLFANIIDAYLGSIMEGVESFLRDTQYQMVVATCENDTEIEKKEIDRMYHRQVDGIIIYPSAMPGNQKYMTDHLQQSSNKKTPIVVIGREIDLDVDHVLFDDYNAGKKSAEIFLNEGKKNFSIITLPINCSANYAREQGFTDTLLSNGIDKSKILRIEKATENIETQIKSLMKCDAIWAVNTGVLLFYITLLKQRCDIRKISCRSLGYNETFLLPELNINVGSMPTRQMGLTAAERLFIQMKQNKIEKKTLIIPFEN